MMVMSVEFFPGYRHIKRGQAVQSYFFFPSIHTPFSDLTQSHGFKFCLYMLMTQMHLSTPGFPFSLVYVNVADQTIHFFTQSTVPLVFLILKKKKKSYSISCLSKTISVILHYSLLKKCIPPIQSTSKPHWPFHQNILSIESLLSSCITLIFLPRTISIAS